MKKIHIFKAGEQISSTGFKKEFTEGDLESMVESFDPNTHEPPIRIGHEDNDKVPAFGWVKKLEKKGPNLYAYVDLTPEMEEMIAKGHYRKVSASFYSPSSEVNPKRGHYTLKHVAMLGGTPPAVKGLEPFGFSEANGELHTMEIEFEEENPMEENLTVEEKIVAPTISEEEEPQAEFKQKVEIEIESEEEEEEGLPEEEDMEMGDASGKKDKKHSMDADHSPKKEVEMASCGDKKKKEAMEEPTEEDMEMGDPSTKKGHKSSYSEDASARIAELEAKFAEMQAKEEEAQAMQAKLEELEAKFAEMEAAKAEAEALLLQEKQDRKREVIGNRIEALYSEGKLAEGIYGQSDLFDFAVGLEEGTLDFAEGESAADTLLSILERIPAPVDFSEVAGDADVVTPQEEEPTEFSERVERYAVENQITFEQALKEMARQGLA